MSAPVGIDDVVTARAPAKINLHLGVGPLGSDSYHDIVTVFCAVSLTDEVVATGANGLSVTVSGEGASSVPSGSGNLAYRAASMLADRAGIDPDVALSIHKAIPVAAGLAGGSADAAAALVACDALWQTGAERQDLLQIAADLGSDIAFSLTGGLSLGAGRGNLLSPVLAAGKWHWVLAVAKGGLATPKVYAELDRLRGTKALSAALDPPQDLLNALRHRDLDALAAALHNDLEPAAFSLMPALRQTSRGGLNEGALAALLCGSGPTFAFLVKDEDAAVDLAARLAGLGVCRTVRTVKGPVTGARVIG